MNVDRIISMVIRQAMNLFIRKGMSAGINAVSKGRGKKANESEVTQLTPAEVEQIKASRESAKRAQKTAKITRRL